MDEVGGSGEPGPSVGAGEHRSNPKPVEGAKKQLSRQIKDVLSTAKRRGVQYDVGDAPSSLLDKLIKQGLLSHQGHGGSGVYGLTPKGEKALKDGFVEGTSREAISQEDADKAFAMLEKAIKKEGIPRKPGAAPDKHVSPDEFMYMQTAKGYHQFKHSRSRNYVFVHERTGKLVVPAMEDKPFMKGDFPKGSAQPVAKVGKILSFTVGNLRVRADEEGFSINEVEGSGSRIYSTYQGRKRNARAFHKWAEANREKLAEMSFAQVMRALKRAGISFLKVK